MFEQCAAIREMNGVDSLCYRDCMVRTILEMNEDAFPSYDGTNCAQWGCHGLGSVPRASGGERSRGGLAESALVTDSPASLTDQIKSAFS